MSTSFTATPKIRRYNWAQKVPEVLMTIFTMVIYGFNFVILFGIIVATALHELGHYLACKYYKVLVVDFFVGMSGGYVEMEGRRRFTPPPPEEAMGMISLAGPIFGTLTAGPLAWIGFIVFEDPAWMILLQLVILINLTNLIPLLPFDGGWAIWENFKTRPTSFLLTVTLIGISAGAFVGMAIYIKFPTAPGWAPLPLALALPGIIIWQGRQQWDDLKYEISGNRRLRMNWRRKNEGILLLYLATIFVLAALMWVVGFPTQTPNPWFQNLK